jgi:hypothetical protein
MNKIKNYIISKKHLFRVVMLVAGFMDLLKNRKLKFMTESYRIVFYCASHSHLDTVMSVIKLCNDDNLKVALVTSFNLNASEVGCLDKVAVYNNFKIRILPFFNTKLLLTPHVGLQAESRPRGCRTIHFLISLTSLDGVYGSQAFDNYDYIFCAGDHQIDDFRRWARTNRRLEGKVLLPGGYPKLDSQMKDVSFLSGPERLQGETPCVVYAPTHVYSVNEKLASLRLYGEAIITAMLDAGYRVIFRPHPVSFYDDDKGLVNDIVAKFDSHHAFRLDDSKNYMQIYSESDFMITDLSGTGFTYSFTFDKPSIFFAHNEQGEEGLIGIQYEHRSEIGKVVRSITQLADASDNILENIDTIKQRIATYRNKSIFNLNTGSKYFMSQLNYIANDDLQKDWVMI